MGIIWNNIIKTPTYKSRTLNKNPELHFQET